MRRAAPPAPPGLPAGTMGINGLLKLLEAAKQKRHVSAYANQRVAVDAYCWLHKAVYSCSTELALGVPTDK